MNIAGSWLRIIVLAGILVALPFAVVAAALDVSTSGRIDAGRSAAWCAADYHVNLSRIITGGCTLRPVQPGDLSRGLDERAFWMQMELSNPGSVPLDRWITVGAPRTEEVSLFYEETAGEWNRLDGGIRTPLSQRHEIVRAYGALPLYLPPDSQKTIWIRVASQTAVDLSVTIWAPGDFMEISGRTQFSMTLALGALLIATVFSLIAFVLEKEAIHVFLAISFLGEVIIEAFRSTLLQRYALPETQAMPVELAAIGSFLAVAGFSGFFRSYVPAALRSGWLYRTYVVLVIITLAAQIWSCVVDYRSGVAVWATSVNIMILVGMVLAAKAWRQGMGSAGTLVLSFVFIAVLELLRLGGVYGLLPYFWGETMSGPWALVMTTPLIFVSIFQRSRELRFQLLEERLTNTARVEFLAKMSHELRAPLDTILGNAQLLTKENSDYSIHAGVDMICRSGRHLLGMVDDLLDHARGVAGKLVLKQETVHWPDFLREVTLNATLTAGEKDNRFVLRQHGDVVKWLILDAARLRQVLDNLIGNAARHTRGGEITLTVSVARLEGARVRLDMDVTDTGDGIAAEDLERIFLPFERGTNAGRSGKGTGMGLTISRQLVEIMGGKLNAQSQLAHGARFEFSVLSNEIYTEPDVCIKRDCEIYSGPQRTIIVVDDDAGSIAVITVLLRSHGFMTLSCDSGQKALGLLRQVTSIDLVLTDQFMEDGDGWYILRAVAEQRPEMPMVLMSTALPQRPVGFPANLDFSAFIMKPLEHQSLLRLLGRLLSVDWESAEPGRSDGETGFADLDFPDEAALNDLRWMIQNGAVSDMMDWAENLKASNPRLEAFASKVSAAARTLDFSVLHDLAGDHTGRRVM